VTLFFPPPPTAYDAILDPRTWIVAGLADASICKKDAGYSAGVAGASLGITDTQRTPAAALRLPIGCCRGPSYGVWNTKRAILLSYPLFQGIPKALFTCLH